MVSLQPNGVNIHQQSPEHHTTLTADTLHNVNLNTAGPGRDLPTLGAEATGSQSPSQAATKTTFDDLVETLKQLEQDEKLPTARKGKDTTQKKNSWCKKIQWRLILKTKKKAVSLQS